MLALELYYFCGKTFEDIGIGKDFLKRTSIAHKIRARIDKWVCTNYEASVQQRKQLPE
jgi:hypothetical protein